MCKMKSLKDAMYGLAIGDALGSPVQFQKRDSYPIVSEMMYCDIYHKKAGTWTDDTSLALALCDSLKHKKSIDEKDILERFRKWLFHGKYTQDGQAFDIGRTCHTSIISGKGINRFDANGNGSLMRIIPLAFWENITDSEIDIVSSVTHAHHIACEGCRIYIHIAKDLINGINIADAVLNNAPKLYSEYTRLSKLQILTRDQIKSTGYVVDTLEAALWCLLHSDNFKNAVMMAVNLGGDTDSIGAVTGGLAGIMYGYDQIPESWIKSLRKKKMIDQYLFQ